MLLARLLQSAVILIADCTTLGSQLSEKVGLVMWSQRGRRHFKSGQATAIKRSLMHVNGAGGGGSTTGK